jgi:hypothetical protein
MLVSYYRQQGTFMNGFGAAVRTVPLDKVKSAMVALGKKASGYPRTSDFFEALAKEVGTPTAGEVAKAAGAGVTEAGKAVFDAAIEVGKSSLMLYIAIAAIGVFVLPKLPALLKNAKLK